MFVIYDNQTDNTVMLQVEFDAKPLINLIIYIQMRKKQKKNNKKSYKDMLSIFCQILSFLYLYST